MGIEKNYAPVPAQFSSLKVVRGGEDNIHVHPSLFEETFEGLLKYEDISNFVDLGEDDEEPVLSIITFKDGSVSFMFTQYGSMNVDNGYFMLGEKGWEPVKTYKDTLKFRIHSYF
jgi:hypothetical protein